MFELDVQGSFLELLESHLIGDAPVIAYRQHGHGCQKHLRSMNSWTCTMTWGAGNSQLDKHVPDTWTAVIGEWTSAQLVCKMMSGAS